MFQAQVDILNQSLGLNSNLTSFAGIINTLVPAVMVLAGLVLFIMFLMGGFIMLTSAANPEQAQKGQQQITTAITGFIIIFVSYWIVQILEIVLGINIF